jgi:hypothetical protein
LLECFIEYWLAKSPELVGGLQLGILLGADFQSLQPVLRHFSDFSLIFELVGYDIELL